MVSKPEFRAAALELTGQPEVSELQAAFEAAHLEVPHVRAKGQELEDLFREMQDAGDDSSVIGGRQRRVHRGEQGSGGSEQARRQNYIQQILLDIQDQIDRLSRQIRQLERHISDMKIAHDALQNGEMGVDDALRDKAVQRAIKAWEKRHGQKFDPKADNVDVLLVDILAEQMQVDRDEVEVLKRDKDDLENRHSDFAHAMNTGKPIDFTKAHYDSLVQDYVAAGNNFDRSNPPEEDVTALMDFSTKSSFDAADNVEEKEQDLTGTFLAKWRGKENTPEFAAAADAFIAKLDQDTRNELMGNEVTNSFLLTRLKVFEFNILYGRIEKLKGQPSYENALQGILKRFDEKTKVALLEEQHVSVDVKDALVSSSILAKNESQSVGSRLSGDLKIAFQDKTTTETRESSSVASSNILPSNNFTS